MNKPRNKDNFLIEVTPEVKDEVERLYIHSDKEPVVEIHYSPYWKSESKGVYTPGGW